MSALPEMFGPPPDGVMVPPGVHALFTAGPMPPVGFSLIPQGAIKVQVRSLPQSTDYSCGACALGAVAAYFGLTHNADPRKVEKNFIALCKTTPQEGTSPEHMEEAARRLGLRVMQEGDGMTLADLDGWLSQGVPVVVDLQAWGPDDHPDYAADRDDGHYVVVIGSDADNLYFEDPVLTGTRASLPREVFLRAWHDVDDGKATSCWGLALSRDEEAEPMG